MSMQRAIRRNIIRVHGKKKETNPSGYLRAMWNKLQIKKWGVKGRIRHLVHASKPKRLWAQRYVSNSRINGYVNYINRTVV